jgi:hypothetical protein
MSFKQSYHGQSSFLVHVFDLQALKRRDKSTTQQFYPLRTKKKTLQTRNDSAILAMTERRKVRTSSLAVSYHSKNQLRDGDEEPERRKLRRHDVSKRVKR